MKQRSIAGPVVLIAIGVVFLIHNIRPEFSFWQNFARYWPFLVIGIGVLRLAEVLVDAGRGKPIQTRGSRGGFGVGGLIIVCVVLWAAGHNRQYIHVGNWNNGSLEIFGEQYDYPISQKGATDGVTLLILDNLRGNITVTGSDDLEYKAEGRKTIRAYNKNEADSADAKCPLIFTKEGNQLVVRMDESQVTSDRRVSADMDLRVPRGVTMEARGKSGDISVNSLSGSVTIASDRGDVRLSEIGGNVKVSMTRSALIRAVDMKGNVDLDGRGSDMQLQNIAGQVTINGSYSGTMDFKNLSKPLHFQSPQTDMRVERLPGSLTLDLGDLRATNVVGPMRLKTKSRDIHIEDFTDAMDLNIDRGDVELITSSSPLGKIDVHAHNGNVELALPGNAVFDLKADTAQGEAHNDFGSSIRMEAGKRSASLRSVSTSGTPVSVSTDRGTISLRKSGNTPE